MDSEDRTFLILMSILFLPIILIVIGGMAVEIINALNGCS